MMARDSVTLWHFAESSEIWTKSFFPKAHVYDICGIDDDGSHAGKKSDNVCTVRLYTNEFVDINEGDYVLVGKSDLSSPDKELCFSVKSFCDNRHFALPHYRLSCV